MIRLATLNDMDHIWSLRLKTSALLKSRGVDQWQYHKPEKETFIKDINDLEFYVYELDQKIIGMIAIKSGVEHTYLDIFEGKWEKEAPYFTIHRLAVDQAYLGKQISVKLMTFAHELAMSKSIYYMRIDTHEDNLKAQKLFVSMGYQLRGYILLEKDHPGERKRLAYDLTLDGGLK